MTDREAVLWQELALESGEAAVYRYERPEDWRQWEVLALEICIPQGSLVELAVEVEPLRFGRPEYISSARAVTPIAGEGWLAVEVDFGQFDAMELTGAFWRLVSQVKLTAVQSYGNPCANEGRHRSGDDWKELGRAGKLGIRNVRLKKRGRIALEAEGLSLAGEAGERLEYSLIVANLTDGTQAVAVRRALYGFESVEVSVKPSTLVLEPGASAAIQVSAIVHEGMAPGGYEEIVLQAVPNGNASAARELTLYAVRRLPHPYILHTEAGWAGVKCKADQHDWAKVELTKLVSRAENWQVPEALGAGAPHAFGLFQRFDLHAAAVAWKLTGRTDLRDKAVELLRRFADPQTGYPATDSPFHHIYASEEERLLGTPRGPKVCSGGLIHEGEFMFDVTACYDLLYEEEVWTEEDRARMEAAFRIFMDKADWMVRDGDTNNIPSGGMAGALLCSMVLQDMERMKRFIDGPGGYKDMVRTGVMDDGWYFEGASNYVLLFADMFARLAQAGEAWGLNLKGMQAPPSYRSDPMLAPWSLPAERPFLGMSFRKLGPVRRNVRSVKDVWDAMLPFIDDRGFLVGNNDSTDKDIGRFYDLAYHLWRDPRYVSVIGRGSSRDLVFGEGELPENTVEHDDGSAFADNVGLAVLRSQASGRPKRAQLQAVLKYGSHGGYHGHFDRAGLVSIRRHGRNAYGPLASWFGYDSFMFKMWVQASMSHNMVVVDQRMQEPAEARRVLFHQGSMLQACAVETVARWSDPPYGGQTPYPESFPRERGLIEGREVPVPPASRAQGDIGDYSEPVLQRRLLAVTDDYAVVADYLCGEEEHTYDCLYHFQGFRGLEGDGLELAGHTGKMNSDPYGAGQFISDCSWYKSRGPVTTRFSHFYDKKQDDSEGRHMLFNEDGLMHTDVHLAWPPQAELMAGWYAEGAAVNKVINYQIIADDAVLEEDSFGAWILGRRSVSLPLEDVQVLRLTVKVDRQNRKSVFWADPMLVLADGSRLSLLELPGRFHNVDPGNGPDKDYYGGPVHLEGEQAARALPFEPAKPDEAAEAVYDLRGLGAVAFEGTIGGDYPLGNDPARRKTVSFRSVGREAAFITVLELYEDKPQVLRAEASSPLSLDVHLADGRMQRLRLEGLCSQKESIGLTLEEWSGESLLRKEAVSG